MREAGITALCGELGVLESDFRLARRQTGFVYIEKQKDDPKSGKRRNLCYPPNRTILYAIQVRIKDRILALLELLPEVRGYRVESHNINSAAIVSGAPFLGTVDIASFHPSITPRHVASALVEHGVSPSWAREIARLVTYKGKVPQGAPTSNHISNVVIDSLLRRYVKAFAEARGVGLCNFGDDIAFYGDNAAAVTACVAQAKRAFAKLGFTPNNKCRDAEHRGGRRDFIGCATGRTELDYPRAKYRALRKELRAFLLQEQNRTTARPITTKSQLHSLYQRILYVRRLNRRKAKTLFDTFHRLCAMRWKKRRIA